MSGINGQNQIIFREARTVDELRQLLKLRLTAYRSSRLSCVVKSSGNEIDFDEFDLRSHHFGLFEQQGDAETPRGYMRIFTNAPQQDMPIHLIAEAEKKQFNCGDALYPCQTHGNYDELNQLINNARQNGFSLVEPSRLVISSGRRGVQQALFLLECAIAWWIKGEYDMAILACISSQGKAYERYGFIDIISDKVYPDSFGRGRRLVLYSESIPTRRRNRLNALAKEFKTHGQIRVDGAFPLKSKEIRLVA